MAFSDKIADEFVGQSIDIDRFSEGVRRDVLGLLNDLQDSIIALITKYDIEGVQRTTYKYRRAEQLLAATRGSITPTYRDAYRTTNDQLLELADIQNKAIPDLFNTAFRADIMTTSLTRGDLRALVGDTLIMGGPAKTWWTKQATDLQHR